MARKLARISRGARLKLIVTWALFGLVALALSGCSLGPINFGGDSTSGSSSAKPGPSVPPATPTLAQKAVEGRVEDAYTGQPIGGVQVNAGGTLTQTNSGGNFSFDAVPPDVKLAAKADGYAPATADAKGSSNVVIKLRPTTLSGKVTDASTSKPLAAVLVKLVLPSEPITPTTPLTNTVPITQTVLPAATATTSTLGYGKGLAAPPGASLVFTSATSTAAPVIPTEVLPTNTPVPPTATFTPKPIPPTGPGFVAVYTDDSGNYSFKDVPEGASLSFKMPGYKLVKAPVGNTVKKDQAMEVFKAEAIYITAPVMATEDLYDPLIKFAQSSRINAVVVNVQNDNSEWVFDTQNPDVLAAKNTDLYFHNMADQVKALKDKGLYTIARIVTFQEPTMAKARLDWAVKSSVTGKAWLGGQLNQQAWLDASVPAAQDYVVSMTKEVLALGFDEIQYDYVRFPSDPAPREPGKPVFSQPLTDTTKALAIEQFLTKAYAVIQPSDAFMSIDIFGYTLWPDQEGKPLNGVIGQVFENMVNHTDYICPMIYPSHFTPGEEGCSKPAACAYELVHRSGEFAQQRFAGKRAKYRPWLEDFDWAYGKVLIDYTSPGTTLVADQIRAAKETNTWGWQWWDAANEYQPRAAFMK